MTGGMARERAPECDRLADLYVTHAPEGIAVSIDPVT
jgi:hypothetical protein